MEGDRIRPDDFSFDIAAENTGSLTSPQAIVFIKTPSSAEIIATLIRWWANFSSFENYLTVRFVVPVLNSRRIVVVTRQKREF